MGDVALTVPVILALIHDNPHLKISVLTKAIYADVLKDIPKINVISADIQNKYKGLKGLYKLSQAFKPYHFYAVADLHNVLRSQILRFLLKLQSIKVKAIRKGRADKKALTRTKNKVFKPLKHTTERYADVFKRMGYDIDLSTPKFLFKPDLETKIINDFKYSSAQKHIGMAPFAAHDGKTYPSRFDARSP